MTLITLRPNATTSNTGSIVGAGTAHAALNDNSDASFVTFSAAQAAQLAIDDLTLPAGAVVKLVGLRARVSSASPSQCAVDLATPDSLPPDPALVAAPGTSPFTLSSALVVGWTDPELDAATLIVSCAAGTATIYELYVDATIVNAPVVTVTAPTGAVTVTNAPTVRWTDALDLDGGPQTAWAVKIFSAAQYGAGGFSPDTSAAVVSLSGATSALSAAMGVIPDGTYRAYVQVAQTVNGAQLLSAWSFSAFTQAVAAPAPPTVTVTPEHAAGRQRVDISANLIGNDGFEVNLTGWVPNSLFNNPGATLIRVATPVAFGSGAMLIGSPSSPAFTGAEFPIAASFVAGATYTFSVYLIGGAGGEAVTLLLGAAGDAAAGSVILTAAFARYQLQWTPSFNHASANVAIRHDVASVVNVYADAAMVTKTPAAVPYVAGAASASVLDLERSLDNGVTWQPVRQPGVGLVDRIADVTGLVYDWEAPNGAPVLYRARALHDYGGTFGASAWTVAAPSTWSAGQWWLKHPNLPGLNMPVDLIAYGPVTRAARQGVFQPLGAALPIVVSETRAGATGAAMVRTRTTLERNQLQALLTSPGALLLQGPAAAGEPDRYVKVGDAVLTRTVENAAFLLREIALPWTEVAQPAGGTA